MVGGDIVRVGVEGTGAQGFISGGMLSVSKDTHFTHSQKKKWVPHTLTMGLLHPCSLLFVIFSNFILTASLAFFLFFPSSPSFSHPSILHYTLCSALHHSGFVIATLCVTLTLSLLSPVPSSPHVTPISVSPVCFVTARQSFFFMDQAIPE